MCNSQVLRVVLDCLGKVHQQIIVRPEATSCRPPPLPVALDRLAKVPKRRIRFPTV
jgi:hypothetical protein